MHPAVTYDPEKLAAVCREYHVEVLEAFGSVVREDFDPGRSDIDLLCVYDREKRREAMETRGGIWTFGIEADLAAVFGRACDVTDIDNVENPYFLGHAMKQRERLYAA